MSHDDPWYCHLHPDPDQAACSAPGSSTAAAMREEGYVVQGAPGYLQPGGYSVALLANGCCSAM